MRRSFSVSTERDYDHTGSARSSCHASGKGPQGALHRTRSSNRPFLTRSDSRSTHPRLQQVVPVGQPAPHLLQMHNRLSDILFGGGSRAIVVTYFLFVGSCPWPFSSESRRLIASTPLTIAIGTILLTQRLWVFYGLVKTRQNVLQASHHNDLATVTLNVVSQKYYHYPTAPNCPCGTQVIISLR